MTDQFFTLFKSRLAELVVDLSYLHKPSGLNMRPQIIDVMMERPTERVDEGEEYPFVRWMIHKGEFSRQGLLTFTVIVDAGVYTGGTVDDGNADITGLCLALGRIVRTPVFSPYRLDGPVRFTIGSSDQAERNPGIQPHPYYHCRLAMDFAMAVQRT